MKVNSKQLKRIIQEEIRQLRNEGDYGDFRSDEEPPEEEIDVAALKKAAGLEDPDDPPADPEDPDDPEGEMEMPEDLGESADLYALWGEIAGITEGGGFHGDLGEKHFGSEEEARDHVDNMNAKMGGKDDPHQGTRSWTTEERADGWYAIELEQL